MAGLAAELCPLSIQSRAGDHFLSSTVTFCILEILKRHALENFSHGKKNDGRLSRLPVQLAGPILSKNQVC